MKSKRILLALLLMLLIAVSGCTVPSRKTGYRAYSGTVSVSLGLGKEGILVDESPLPVTVHIEGDYAQQAAWCVLAVPTNAADYYAYRHSLTKEDAQTVSYIVPAATGASQIVIELLDDQERVIYSRTCTYQAYSEWQSMMLCGQMGTQTDTVSWPDEVVRDDTQTRVSVRSVTLTEDNLYTDKEGYYALDFLSTDVSYFEDLSGDVQNAMLEWVKSGGTLVLQGTGAWMLLSQCGVTDLGPVKNFAAGGSVRMIYRTYGDGSIWSVDDTLSQVVARLTDSKKSELLKALCAGASGCYSNDYSSIGVYDQTPLVYQLRQNKSSAKAPNAKLYIMILCIYLAVGIPGIYILALEKKRIRWFRPLVCLLAVGFSMLIFLIGNDTRYSRPFIRSVTVLSDLESSLSDDSTQKLTQTVYAGIQAPFNSSYEVSIKPEYDVKTVMEDYYWENSTANASNTKRVAVISEYEDQTLLSMQNLTAFSVRYFQFRKSTQESGRITGNVTVTESGLSGVLTNQTQYELISAVVNVDDELALIEHWQPGETINLEEQQKNGRVHRMTRDQFLDGGYQNRGQWIGQLSDYYEYFLYRENSQSVVMAQIEFTPEIQEYTDYPVENDTILLLSICQE